MEQEVEAEHGQRRSWVWAKLGWAPLAAALEHLQQLANATQKSLGGTSVAAIADGYCDWGWKADAAVIDALAAVEKAEDVAAVAAAILSLYRPWLEAAAKAFQQAVTPDAAASYVVEPLPQFGAATCVLFCDALRFDAGQRLVAMLEEKAFACETVWRLVAESHGQRADEARLCQPGHVHPRGGRRMGRGT